MKRYIEWNEAKEKKATKSKMKKKQLRTEKILKEWVAAAARKKNETLYFQK